MPELLKSWGPSPHYDVNIEFPVGVCAWPCLTPTLNMECHSLISRPSCCLDILYGARGGWGVSF